MRQFGSGTDTSVRLEDRIDQHDQRITQNEVFRHRVEGAIAVISFLIGGGIATTILSMI